MNRARGTQQGATLVEVLVAMVLFSLGVIGLLRSLGTAVQDAGAIQYRSVAATLADTQLGRMWVDRGALASYVVANEPVPELPNGTRTVTVAGNVVTVRIAWRPPGSTLSSNHRVVATIAGN